MFYGIKFLFSNLWHDFIVKQWDKLPYSTHYRFVSSWLKFRVQEAGDANYFIELIKSYEKELDNRS